MATTTHVPHISLEDLKTRLERKERLTLVNTLSEEWVKKTAGARIPGSHWISVDEVEARFPLLFAKNEPIVTYCGGPQCPSSVQAAEKLIALGYTNVFAFEGGLKEWKEAGLALHTNEDLKASEIAKDASACAAGSDACGA
ncbi:MAG: rhodanese-like domain-containing protein [Armatimonadetes bacterium]|nr:rhodanese-like domain-containing protein [Armatimonadota bacterium]